MYRDEEATAPEEQHQASAAVADLPESEKSRRRFERRLISLLAQNPDAALKHADSLAQTQWHGALNAQLAETMLSLLAEKPGMSAAALISAMSEKFPRAAGSLTSATLSEGEDLSNAVAFLVEELEIGDMEDSLAAMNAQLKQSDDMAPEERDIMFQAVVDLQKTLSAKRAAHKPLV